MTDPGDEAGIDLSLHADTGRPETPAPKRSGVLTLKWAGFYDARSQLLDEEGRDLFKLLPVESVTVEFDRESRHRPLVTIRARPRLMVEQLDTDRESR